jgi:beta-barrel assembly-enhancing protease
MYRSAYLLCALFLLAAVPSAARAQKKNNDPSQIGSRDINKHSLNFYSLDREAALGDELAHEAEITARILSDPYVRAYVTAVAQQIAGHSDLQMPLKVRIVDSEAIAAFGLPNGHLFVTSGLLRETRSEAELAGVIAHEIGHIAARHATKQMTRADLWNYATLPLGFVTGPIAAGFRSSMMLAMPLSLLKFSRDFEREADALGLQYDYATGYDPAAMVDFFERMRVRSNEKETRSIMKAFTSHPMTKDRVTAAEKLMDASLPSREQYVVTSSSFVRMQERLRELADDRRREEKIYGPDPLGRKNPSDLGILFGWQN